MVTSDLRLGRGRRPPSKSPRSSALGVQSRKPRNTLEKPRRSASEPTARTYCQDLTRNRVILGHPQNITSKNKAIYRHLERKVLVGLGWWKKCQCWRTTVGIAHVWKVLSNKLPFGCTHLRSRSHGDPLSTGGITGVAGSVKG